MLFTITVGRWQWVVGIIYDLRLGGLREAEVVKYQAAQRGVATAPRRRG